VSTPTDPTVRAFSCTGCGQIFRALEKTKNSSSGSDRDEMLRAAAERERQVRKAFNDFDRDKSGTIERGELGELLKALGFHEGLIDKEFARADANSDGKVDFQEFTAYYNALQDRLRAPGMLQAANEAAAARAELEEMRRQMAAIASKPVVAAAAAPAVVAKRLGDADVAHLESEFQQEAEAAANKMVAERERQQKALEAKLAARKGAGQ